MDNGVVDLSEFTSDKISVVSELSWWRCCYIGDDKSIWIRKSHVTTKYENFRIKI